MDADHHVDPTIRGRLLDRQQLFPCEVDGLRDQAPVDLPGEVVVVTRSQTPDVLRVSRDIGLGEDHESSAGISGFRYRPDSPFDARCAVQQDRRALDNGDAMVGRLRHRRLQCASAGSVMGTCVANDGAGVNVPVLPNVMMDGRGTQTQAALVSDGDV